MGTPKSQGKNDIKRPWFPKLSWRLPFEQSTDPRLSFFVCFGISIALIANMRVRCFKPSDIAGKRFFESLAFSLLTKMSGCGLWGQHREGFVLELLNLKRDFITHFETRHTLCHGFHGFYFSLRFSMVFMVSMISVWFPWFPWFPYFLCGFHGFCGFHDLFAVSMVSMISLRFPWFPWFP